MQLKGLNNNTSSLLLAVARRYKQYNTTFSLSSSFKFQVQSFGPKNKNIVMIIGRMQIRTITRTLPLKGFSQSSIIFKKNPSVIFRFHSSFSPPSLHFFAPKTHQKRFQTCCINPSQELINNDCRNDPRNVSKNEEEEEEEREEKEGKREGLEKQSTWNKVMEVLKFTGPATGLWICVPLMSLIDTAVIGQGSSIELAALGPATVVCDYLTYVFMFLSIATSNMVATSLARQDKNEVQHQISVLLSVGLTCGFLMLLLTRAFGSHALTAFTGPKNVHIVPAANTYVQIRGLAWPAALVGSIAQSASLGMKDSWGPLKALVVASAIKGTGDVVLCRLLGYGIAGAAWATLVSQAVTAYMMIDSLNRKGYNTTAFCAPSPSELVKIFGLAGPVFLTMISKVAFYALIIYFATSMGAHSVAAHQVMIQTFNMCAVWGEPLSQTAQSFMPELMYGVDRNLKKARMLLKSLVVIGSAFGLILGTIGTSVPWLFPNIFTPDQNVIQEMHKVLIPYFFAIAVTPSINSLEGTLLAGRDLKFISLSMSGCFSLGALVLLLVSSKGFGLPGCWGAILGFQWARFLLSLWRLLSPDGILFSEDLCRNEMQQLKAA